VSGQPPERPDNPWVVGSSPTRPTACPRSGSAPPGEDGLHREPDDRIGDLAARHDVAGQDRTGPDRTGPDRTGPDR